MVLTNKNNKSSKRIIKEIQKVINILVKSICKHLIKPIGEPFSLKLARKDNEAIIEKFSSEHDLQEVIFISTDGTTINTQEFSRIVGLNATANLIWGPELRRPTIVKKYKESKYHIPSMISVERIQMELVTTTCVLRTIRTGKLHCQDCPISKNNCMIQQHKKTLKDLNDFRPVALLDLTIDFSFIKKQQFISPEAKTLILNTVKWVYQQIREYNLEMIFITHGSRDKRFMYEIKSDIDFMFRRSGEFDKKILQEIKKFYTNTKDLDEFSHIKGILQSFNKSFRFISENFTDFDLFRKSFTDKGNSTPLFQILDPNALEYYEGVDAAYRLTTWGYHEIIDESYQYVPLDDIKIGFPLNSDPDFLYDAFLFDTALGRGHSLSLALAHSIISPGRNTRNLIAQILADLNQIPKTLKTIQKWRFFK
ncbi:MAG: hypothetical protein ACFFD2_05345 [Promethearchaeota archaeon]